ncbi:MAG: RNA polymerase sigma factor, partial [Solirubrobacteraceae bacterium]
MQVTAVLAPVTPRIVRWSRMGDESLASRAAAGDEAAFTALYERYHGPLLGYCRSILLDAEDARDATQSALENALRALPRREPGRPLRPWLYRIAHNEAINIVRRRQPVADGGTDATDLLTVPGPEVDAEQRSRLAQLVDDLRMLPERQRGALVMRELSGLSYDEIALALGVSNDAARRCVFDARTALHDAVDGRATACTSVRRTLSDGDRRHLRARGLRAHLRSCDDCATFERAMGARQSDLH